MNLHNTPVSFLRVVSAVLVCGGAICQMHSPAWAGEDPAPIVIRGSSTLLQIVEE